MPTWCTKARRQRTDYENSEAGLPIYHSQKRNGASPNEQLSAATASDLSGGAWPAEELEVATICFKALRLILTAMILLQTASIVLAVTAPNLPAAARKLTASEIIALYDRTRFKFRNFTGKQLVSGTFLVNFARKTASGTYVEGKNKGTWRGTVRMKGDQFCRKIGKHREGCVFLYLDGSKVYEVIDKGVVESLNSKQ